MADRSTRKFFKYIGLVIFSTIMILGVTQLSWWANNFQAIAQPTRADVRTEIRGVWMTNNDLNVLRDRPRLNEALIKLRQLNFNTIYPVVWNSGYVMFPSPTAQKIGIQPFVFKGTEGQDILADVVAQAHNQGLLVIPWFEFGFMTPPTSELAINRKNWLTQKRDRTENSIGEDGEVVWLNPFHPEVQDFITKVVLEAVGNYDVDGVQFDDHMSLPVEFGYDKYTMALYKREALQKIKTCQARAVKQNCKAIPTEPPNNPNDPTWVNWRADKITEFMFKLNKAVKQRKPKAIFSISPNYYEFAYKLQLQDWLAWVRLDIVDELIMQVYRADLTSFIKLIDRPEIQEARKKTMTGIAILTGLRSSPAPLRQIVPQVQAVRERKLGISFFYFNSLWGYGPEPIEERQAQFKDFYP
jgi:uncharacterized lipoprotein YddW (UPF0748 family)